MSDADAGSNAIVRWFRNFVRPIFHATDGPSVVEELDKLGAQVEELDRHKGRLFPICLLGQAGVGKSTLINTLIANADVVVPSGGGTGPLTANALRVVHGERPSFVVRYHSKKQVNDTRFILESHLLRESKRESASDEVESGGDSELPSMELDSQEQRKTRTEEAIGRARLLVAGSQSADRALPYLVDALRWVLEQDSKFHSEITEGDLSRLHHVRNALQLHESSGNTAQFDSLKDPDFAKRLRAHACGFLAPLIQKMSIHWPSQVLKNSLEIIDLPGIGILSDAYASVTSDYLRNRAKAVMLVVDSRGIRRDDADLLKTSGFLNRLLHASSDLSADPVALIIVVVKVDDVAVENWRNDKATHGIAQRTKAEHFSTLVASCQGEIRRRLEDFLRDVWEDDTEGKRLVINSILDKLQVFAVSAPQYRLFHSNDPDDDKPFLPDCEYTNIPALRAAISGIARQCAEEQDRRREETQQRFFGQLRARLEVLSAQMSEERQTEDAITEFKYHLEEFMAPLQREFDTRRGGFRNFLRTTIPGMIQDKVTAASAKAQKSIESDLSKLQDAHWKTLQAAVRREGTYYGSRHINLPHDFALRFEEPVAEVWARSILVQVRRETREFADYQSEVITQVLDWARGQGIKRSTRLLEALVEAVKQHRKQVDAVGKEAVDDLRDQVRAELIKKIEAPIRRKCKKFVEDGQNYGTGVKSRILELFRQLSEDVVEAAAEPAVRLLVESFREVEKEIISAFGDHSDPLVEAAESLIQRQERSIQQEKGKLMAAIESATAAMPND